MTRTGSEFSPETKRQEWVSAGGRCRECARKLFASDRKEYDHIKPIWDGGDGKRENCQLLCGWCHDAKTHKAEAPQRSEMKRHQKKAAGAEAESPYRPLPGGREDKWKRKVSGEWVRRDA